MGVGGTYEGYISGTWNVGVCMPWSLGTWYLVLECSVPDTPCTFGPLSWPVYPPLILVPPSFVVPSVVGKYSGIAALRAGLSADEGRGDEGGGGGAGPFC